MRLLISTRTLGAVFSFMLIAALSFSMPGRTSAQQQQPARAAGEQNRSSRAPLPSTLDPFEAVEQAVATGESTTIRFNRTELDSKMEGVAQAALRGQTLFVRMQAKNVPVPSHFQVPRYALWVYVPNYRVKMYIGDLPITPLTKSKSKDGIVRGVSDTAYRFNRLPPGAVFGGLALTAEPVRFEPIVNEALRPVLVGLLPGEEVAQLVSALTIYSGPVPAAANNTRGEQPAATPAPRNNNRGRGRPPARTPRRNRTR